MIESMMAVFISFTAISAFALIFIEGQKIDQQKERETDRALAHYMMRKNDLNEIKIHDHVFGK